MPTKRRKRSTIRRRPTGASRALRVGRGKKVGLRRRQRFAIGRPVGTAPGPRGL